MVKQRWILVIVSILWLVGCATTKGDWQKAAHLNTIEAYKEFLREHPESEFTKLARERMEQLERESAEKVEWESAKRNDSIGSYQQFLSKYRYGKFSSLAKDRIKELEWQEGLTNVKNIEAYKNFLEGFLKKYPEDRFSKIQRERSEQAQERIQLLEWQKAKTDNSYESYRDFQKKYPRSKFADEAKVQIETIEQQDWQKTSYLNTTEGYKEFLKKYTESKFALLAEEKIMKLEEGKARPSKSSRPMSTVGKIEGSVKYEPFLISGIYGASAGSCRDKISSALAHLASHVREEVVKGYCIPANVELYPGGVAKGQITVMGLGTGPTDNLMEWGSVHQYMGNVTTGMGHFVSDQSYPLTFKMIRGVGYVYLCGRGVVETRDGRKVRIGYDDSVVKWIMLLKDERQYVREGAARALGWIAKDKDEIDKSIKALIESLDDSAWEVRRDAVVSLSRIGDDISLEPMTTHCHPTTEPDEVVRNACEKAIASLKAKKSRN